MCAPSGKPDNNNGKMEKQEDKHENEDHQETRSIGSRYADGARHGGVRQQQQLRQQMHLLMMKQRINNQRVDVIPQLRKYLN